MSDSPAISDAEDAGDAPTTPLERFVGIENQGATCYLNSLLQTLYHLTYFRNAAFKVPTQEDTPDASVPLSLQVLFYHLQTKEVPGATQLLTKSFGWNDEQVMVQHDIQELNRVLCDALAEKMKGTPAEGALEKLFCGYFSNYIKGLDVEYTSTRKEKFYDVQVGVKGFKTLYEALDGYVEPELLDGDNRITVEPPLPAGAEKPPTGPEKVLSRALKGMHFLSFPPVLFLHLRRFELDYNTMRREKVHTRLEFPRELCLAQYIRPQGKGNNKDNLFRNQSLELRRQKSFPCPTEEDWTYSLFGVLVHRGAPTSGHYYGFVRPNGQPQWYLFDDDDVKAVDSKVAVEGSFGGATYTDRNGVERVTTTSAYMLVYIRKSVEDKVVFPTSTEDIDEDLRSRLETVAADEIAKWRVRDATAHSIQITAVTDERLKEEPDLAARDLFDRWQLEATPEKEDEGEDAEADPEAEATPATSSNQHQGRYQFMIPNSSTLGELKAHVASQLPGEVSVDHMRLWVFPRQPNGKYANQPFRMLEGPHDTPLHDDRVFQFPSETRHMLKRIVFVEIARDDIFPLGGRDIAPWGRASQSSNYFPDEYSAHMAITNDGTGMSCSVTSQMDLQPWWRVDFPTVVQGINRVVLTHRRASEDTEADEDEEEDETHPKTWGRLQDIVVEFLVTQPGNTDEAGEGEEEERITWSSPVMNATNVRENPRVLSLDLAAVGVSQYMRANAIRVRRVTPMEDILRAGSEDGDIPTGTCLVLLQVQVFTADRTATPKGPVLPPTTDNSLLLFLKCFTGFAAKYCGYLVVERDAHIYQFLPHIQKLTGTRSSASLLYFCEKRADMLSELDVMNTFDDNGVKTGFCLVVQPYPGPFLPSITAKGHWEYLLDQVAVEVIDLAVFIALKTAASEREEEEEEEEEAPVIPSTTVQLAESMLYGEVQHHVGKGIALEAPPTHLQFYGCDPYNGGPMPSPERQQTAQGPQRLRDLLQRKGTKTNKLFFRVLNIPLDEWEAKLRFCIECFDENVCGQKRILLVLPDDLPRRCMADEVIQWVRPRLMGHSGEEEEGEEEAPTTDVGPLIFFNVYDSSVDKIYGEDDRLPPKVYDLDRWRVDPMPCMVADFDPDDQRLVPVCHITLQDSDLSSAGVRCHGNPFLMYVTSSDTGETVKERIQAQLGVSKGVFMHWRLNVVRDTEVIPVEDDDRVYDVIDMVELDEDVPSLAHLGLEHPPAVNYLEQALTIS